MATPVRLGPESAPVRQRDRIGCGDAPLPLELVSAQDAGLDPLHHRLRGDTQMFQKGAHRDVCIKVRGEVRDTAAVHSAPAVQWLLRSHARIIGEPRRTPSGSSRAHDVACPRDRAAVGLARWCGTLFRVLELLRAAEVLTDDLLEQRSYR